MVTIPGTALGKGLPAGGTSLIDRGSWYSVAYTIQMAHTEIETMDTKWPYKVTTGFLSSLPGTW